MKRIIILLLAVTIGLSGRAAAQYGFGTNSPNDKAIIDASAVTDKGVLIPKVDLSASPITSPPEGLMVYNTSSTSPYSPGFYYWQGTWKRIFSELTFVPTNFPANSAATSVTLTSGNWTVPAGVYKITIEAVGGAGGGGGAGADYRNNAGATAGGGGGGAGEYAGRFLNVHPGDIIGVTTGTAGTAGSAGQTNGTPSYNGGNGGNGGNTIVTLNASTILTANGGQGGIGSVGNNNNVNTSGGNGGQGGTGSTDPQHINGNNGTAGIGSTTNATVAGSGGSGGIGANPTGIITNIGGNGGNGVYSSNGTSNGNSGTAGTAGFVVITYY